MAVRMTHLVWRKGWGQFRFKLPDDLAGNTVPAAWPDSLSDLVNQSRGTFKLEVWMSLRLTKKDEKRAKRVVAAKVVEFTGLVEETRYLLSRGPINALSDQEIAAIAARVHADRLAQDERLRERGIGLRLPSLGDALAIPTHHTLADDTGGPGLTDDDLKFLKWVNQQEQEKTLDAVARMRPPPEIKNRAAAEIGKLRAEVDPDQQRKVALAVLKAEVQAIKDIRARLEGAIIETPLVEPENGTEGDPTLKQAFALWRDGIGVKGNKLPSANTASEAETAVRRFTEMHGNLVVSAIKKSEVRAFRTAIACLPKSLPQKLRMLPLPRLLEQPLEGFEKRSARTVNKSLRLLSAIVSAVAQERDFSDRPNGWRNPFEKLTIKEEGGTNYAPFDTADLKAIFSSSVYTQAFRPKGGRGEAAFWFPLISLFTGARLEEIAQLYVRDIKHVSETGIWFFDITDIGEDQRLKVGEMNRREVPFHAELIRLGLTKYRDQREAEAGLDAPLFPQFKPNASKKRSGAWSKWFNRYLSDNCGITAKRKVFHSFRGTFKDACRNSKVPEDHHDQLTSHAATNRSVGRGYGKGFTVETLNEEVQKVRYPGLNLTALPLLADGVSVGRD
jgi:hypothetical protein